MSSDHAEVVNALQIERVKVAQLANIVKILYDRLALTSGPCQYYLFLFICLDVDVLTLHTVPVHFPHELLDSRPPNLRARPPILGTTTAQTAMDLSGDSLIPSQNTNATASGSRGRQPLVQQTATTRSSRRTRTDPDNSQDSRQSVQKSNSTGSEAFSSQGPPGTAWNSSSAQNTNGVNATRRPAQTRRPDVSQLVPQLQVKHEANVFVR
jgi:hypothetical protein